MASEALSIPSDIAWQRLAWSREMLDRPGGHLPPRWRSSMAIYAYPLPLSDTEEDYPDHRIVYLKLSLTITGWTRSEEIPGAGSLPTGTDRFGADVWDYVTNVSEITAYLPCLSAIAQIAVYPRRPEGTLPDDYPFIVDFEPKKRELYETVTDTNEVLSGSNENTNIRKGHTSTISVEGSVTAKTSIPLVGGAEVKASAGYRRESVDIKTTDESTERRETAGRSTQLSQMYQLFNGYHAGTNRAVFVILPRPHTQTDAEQVEANLIGGERRLEGMQDVFLVVQAPRSADGLCVEAWLDTSHKEVAALGRITVSDEGAGAGGGGGGGGGDGGSGDDANLPTTMVITRCIVSGCGAFVDDRLRPLPPGDPGPRPPVVVGESVLPPPVHVGGFRSGASSPVARKQRVSAADQLNLVQTEVRRVALAAASSSRYAPRPYRETRAFRTLVARALRRSQFPLDELAELNYVTSDEATALRRMNVRVVGDIFAASKGATPALRHAVRERLLDASIKLFSAES